MSDDLVPLRTRRNNLVILVLLILFAVGLCAFVLVSMRIHARRRAANPEATTGYVPMRSVTPARWDTSQSRQGRQTLAHGVSRGDNVCFTRSPGRGVRKIGGQIRSNAAFLTDLPGLVSSLTIYPRLAPWANVCRPCRGWETSNSAFARSDLSSAA